MFRSRRSKAAGARTLDRSLLRKWPLPGAGEGGKDERGRAYVVGGTPQTPGGALLAALASLRAGAGKLQVAVPASVALALAIEIPEALVEGLPETRLGALALEAAERIVERAKSADALTLGPGWFDDANRRRLVAGIFERCTIPTVLDAGAMAFLAEHPSALAPLGGKVVLTPHAGEMARLLGRPREEIEAAPLAHALEAAERFRAIVALKGADTYVATPQGTVLVNRGGNAGLATSGSGDVLAGIIGGLLARGIEPFHAAAWGVYVHARAGDVLGERVGVGFLARELLAEIPLVIRATSSTVRKTL